MFCRQKGIQGLQVHVRLRDEGCNWLATVTGADHSGGKWQFKCSSPIVRILLIVAAISLASLIGAFLLYVSLLAIITTIVIMIGLISSLTLGYYAGLHAGASTPRDVQQPKEIVAHRLADSQSRLHMVGH